MQCGRNVLYHNNGNGTFTDVTDKTGVAGAESGMFHSGATFFDYDRDGRLDLYVGSYVAFGPDVRRYCDIGGKPAKEFRPLFDRAMKLIQQRYPDRIEASRIDRKEITISECSDMPICFAE